MSGRILEFTVEKQRLTRKRGCDFSGIVAGSVGYLTAKFEFSSEWDNCAKVANFEAEGLEPMPVLLDKNGFCLIPSQVLKGDRFSVYILGGKPGYRIETGKLKVRQEVT